MNELENPFNYRNNNKIELGQKNERVKQIPRKRRTTKELKKIIELIREQSRIEAN